MWLRRAARQSLALGELLGVVCGAMEHGVGRFGDRVTRIVLEATIGIGEAVFAAGGASEGACQTGAS